MYLIINTISEKSLVALAGESKLRNKIVWESDYQQSEELLVKIDQLLKVEKVGLEKIRGVIVVNGPGSYTGVRVGVATGNALGLALKVPVIGITYLDILANYASSQFLGDGKIISLIKSIKDKFYFGVYYKKNKQLKLTNGYGNNQFEDILSLAGKSVFLVGDVKGKAGEQMKIIPVDCADKLLLAELARMAEYKIKKADKNS